MTQDSWRDEAACRDHPLDWWFPENGDDGSKAKKICATCPAANQCLTYAVTVGETHGIYAGLNAKSRRAGGRPPHPCGSEAKYRAGCRCSLCRRAAADAARARRDRKGDPQRHGTTYAYTTLGCRCDDCRHAKVSANQRSRTGNANRGKAA